ncbi:UNVERIFIED_CONTAM: hypothetical protein FKN15_011731 [Acipenser sinensis]
MTKAFRQLLLLKTPSSAVCNRTVLSACFFPLESPCLHARHKETDSVAPKLQSDPQRALRVLKGQQHPPRLYYNYVFIAGRWYRRGLGRSLARSQIQTLSSEKFFL